MVDAQTGQEIKDNFPQRNNIQRQKIVGGADQRSILCYLTAKISLQSLLEITCQGSFDISKKLHLHLH